MTGDSDKMEYVAQRVRGFIAANTDNKQQSGPVAHAQIAQFVSRGNWDVTPDDAIAAALEREYIESKGDGYVPGDEPEEKLGSDVLANDEGTPPGIE